MSLFQNDFSATKEKAIAKIKEVEALPEKELEAALKAMHKYGDGLVKGYQTILTIRAEMETASKEEQTKLLIRYSKGSKVMKKLCVAWDKQVKPYANILVDDPKTEEYENAYLDWSNIIEQRRKAKRGEGENVSAVSMMEEHIYAKALVDVENFWDAFNNKELVRHDFIDNEVKTLEKHFLKWQGYIAKNGGKSCMPNELKAMERMLDNVRKDWGKARPTLLSYQKAYDAFDNALAKGDTERAKQLLMEMELLTSKI